MGMIYQVNRSIFSDLFRSFVLNPFKVLADKLPFQNHSSLNLVTPIVTEVRPGGPNFIISRGYTEEGYHHLLAARSYDAAHGQWPLRITCDCSAEVGAQEVGTSPGDKCTSWVSLDMFPGAKPPKYPLSWVGFLRINPRETDALWWL
jgi:hypothetical protein